MNIQLRYQDEGPGFLLLMAKIFFVFIAGVVAFYFFYYEKNTPYALVSLGVSLVIFYILVSAWPQPPPVVLINEEGILDRRLGFVIFWVDLIDAQIEVNGPFLCLRLKDPEIYISKLPPGKRENIQFQQSLGFRMLNIEMKGFAVDLLSLLDLVRQKIKEIQKS